MRPSLIKNGPINILFVTSWFPNRVHLQDGNFVRAFAEAVAEEHAVTVLHVAEDPGLAKGELETEQETLPWGKLVRVYYAGDGAQVQRRWLRSRAWQAAVNRLSKVAFDLIHAHVLIDGGIVAARLSRKWHIPFLVSEHSHRYLASWPWQRRLEWWLAKRAAAKASVLLPVSPSLEQGMQRHHIQGTYAVLPNIVAEQCFFPPTLVDQTRPFTYLHVSDFTSNKRIDQIIRAFAALTKDFPEAQLRLAGNGDPAPYLALSQSLHLRPRQIIFSGPHERVKIAELLRDCDCFVLASELETQSVVLLEALLSGLPVVTTDCGGPADLIDAKTPGKLVPVNDLNALREALQEQISRGKPSVQQRQLLGERMALRYGKTATIKRLLEHYARALAHQDSNSKQ